MAHRSTSDSTPATPAPVPSPLKDRMEYERGSDPVNGMADSDEVRLLLWGNRWWNNGGESER